MSNERVRITITGSFGESVWDYDHIAWVDPELGACPICKKPMRYASGHRPHRPRLECVNWPRHITTAESP